MRTIRLKEHQTDPTKLSPAELNELLGAGKYISITRLSEAGLYGVRPGSTVGTLVLESIRVLIKPKVDLSNVFFLLGYGAGLSEWGPERFPYATDPDFFHALGWAFEAEVERGLRQGLHRGYVPREEALTTVRGRIDMARQLRGHQTRALPLECRFEEYTEDIELNHVLKAAHRRLRMAQGIDPVLSKRLLFRQRSFADVTDVDFPSRRVPSLSFTRLNQHWEPAARLAELILRQETLVDEAGSVVGAAFTVDMNKLFERFVTRLVGEEAQAAGLELDDQAERSFTNDTLMKPDLVLVAGGRDAAVGDVKYKKTELDDWPNADLYQLLAYCTALGLTRGLLIYANYQLPQHSIVRRAGIQLETVGIDMTGSHQELEAQTRTAARILIDHATQREAVA